MKVYGVNNIPNDKPVLLLANHQNALLDALLIAGNSKRFAYFLTRAAVFKKSLVSRILMSLQMLPVYRIRDGWNTIANNNAIFDNCTELLANNEAVVIFPEGSHNLVRRVRPLSKGFTRIVFDALEKYPNLDLKLIPVGLNFVAPTSCPDSTAIYFGQPINAQDFIRENRAEGVKDLKFTMHAKIAELTTHIPEEDYEQQLQILLDKNVDLLDPYKTNSCLTSNFKHCNEREPTKNNVARRLLRFLLIIALIVPYLVWRLVVKPKVKEPEFISTFRFAVALTLVPAYIIVVAVWIAYLFGFGIGLLSIATILLLTFVATRI